MKVIDAMKYIAGVEHVVLLQKNLKEKNRLLGVLVALSGIAHGSICGLLFSFRESINLSARSVRNE